MVYSLWLGNMLAFCPNSSVMGVEDGVVVDGKDWLPLRSKTDIVTSSCWRGGGEVVRSLGRGEKFAWLVVSLDSPRGLVLDRKAARALKCYYCGDRIVRYEVACSMTPA